jgi:glycosyltransferase involved in cell wall biosynthesis
MPAWRGGRPLKRWTWVGAFGPELMLCAAVARIGPATAAWWAVWDRAGGRFEERSLRRAGGLEVTPARILFSDNGMAAAQVRTVPRVPSDAIRFGYFGTISDWKGIHLIVEAFNGLPEAGLEGKIYGDLTFLPDYSRRLRNERRNLALRFLGRFPNAQIAEVLAEIDVLIVPSVWFENSPLTIHEAFIAGVPVVCSDRGGMAELVADGKNGLHFRLGDAVDLRRKLQRFLDEPGLLADLRGDFPAVKDIASDARDMVERYNALIAGQTVTA